MRTQSIFRALFAMIILSQAQAVRCQDLFPVIEHGKYGFINKKGAFVINAKYDYAKPFSEGLALVRMGDAFNGKYGFLNENGDTAIAISYDEALSFSEGLAMVRIGTYETGKCGFIDKAGKYVIEAKFSDALSFNEGFASVKTGTEDNGRWGVIDKKGSFRVSPVYLFVNSFSDGIAGFCDAKEQKGKWGLLDKTGNIILQPYYDDLFIFSEGLAVVRIGDEKTGRYGYIDKTGKLAIPAKFKKAQSFSEGLAAAQSTRESDLKFGYINKKGKEVIKPTYDKAMKFSNGIAGVCTFDGLDMKWGYIDKEDHIAFKKEFKNISPFTNNCACVMVNKNGNSRWAQIDKTGKSIWEEKTGEGPARATTASIKPLKNELLEPLPASPRECNQRGVRYSLIGRFDSALYYFDKVLATDNNSPQAYFNTGLIKYRTEEYETAEKNFSKAIELNADFATAYYHRGICRFRIAELLQDTIVKHKIRDSARKDTIAARKKGFTNTSRGEYLSEAPHNSTHLWDPYFSDSISFYQSFITHTRQYSHDTSLSIPNWVFREIAGNGIHGAIITRAGDTAIHLNIPIRKIDDPTGQPVNYVQLYCTLTTDRLRDSIRNDVANKKWYGVDLAPLYFNTIQVEGFPEHDPSTAFLSGKQGLQRPYITYTPKKGSAPVGIACREKPAKPVLRTSNGDHHWAIIHLNDYYITDKTVCPNYDIDNDAPLWLVSKLFDPLRGDE